MKCLQMKHGWVDLWVTLSAKDIMHLDNFFWLVMTKDVSKSVYIICDESKLNFSVTTLDVHTTFYFCLSD